MPDITSITAAISGLKAATEVAKFLRDTEQAFKAADLKLRIAELVDGLATAKLSLAEIQDALAERDAEIKRLTGALKLKGEVVRHHDSYYNKTAEGKPTGDPYCSFCFEAKALLVHINQNPKERSQSICPGCKNIFAWQRRQNPQPEAGN